MPRFAANLSFLYQELPFLDRFDAAAKDGFSGVECLFPYDTPAEEIRRRADHLGLHVALINAHPGDWLSGERGLASLPGREDDFRLSVDRAIEYARIIGAPRFHVLAGLRTTCTDRNTAVAVYEERLRWAAERAAPAELDVLIEPINPRDMPGYLLQRQEEAHAIVLRVGAPNLKVQMDLYHCQIVEGDVSAKLRRYLPTGRVAHLQIAGVPDRQEPDGGELNYAHLFAVIDELSDPAQPAAWDGWVGCEYRPRRGAEPGGTSAGLGWMRAPGGDE